MFCSVSIVVAFVFQDEHAGEGEKQTKKEDASID